MRGPIITCRYLCRLRIRSYDSVCSGRLDKWDPFTLNKNNIKRGIYLSSYYYAKEKGKEQKNIALLTLSYRPSLIRNYSHDFEWKKMITNTEF